MKVLPSVMVLLTLSFGTAQAVSWADCCCGSFCEHKTTCTGCGPEDNCRGNAGTSSCCDPEGSHQKTCSHLEPSSEIETVAVEGPDLSPAVIELLPAVDAVLPVPSPAPAPAPVDTGPPRPLHLDLSVLRI